MRRTIISPILSAVVMGLGQFINRQYLKGFSMLLLYILGLYYSMTNLGHALWGVITLGEKAQHLEKVGRINKMVHGDHSIFLLVQGLIVIFLIILFVVAYILNIRDAYRTAVEIEQGNTPNNFGQTLKKIGTKNFPLLIITPQLIFLFFFTILPLIFSLLIAFTDYSSPKHIPPANLVDWIGFSAFKDLFTLSTWAHTFYGVFAWTVAWAVLSTLSCFFGGFLIAVLLQQKGIIFKKFFRTVYMLPFAIPGFVSLLIMRNLFNTQFGPLTQYLNFFGIQGPPWLSDPTWAKGTILLVNFWLGFPISMLMITGILTTIPRDLYEAAEVDGASGFQKFRMITFPAVMFALTPIVIGQFAGNFNNFNVIYLMTNGNPVNSDYQFAGHTDILITWLYNLSINNGKYNFASVIGIMIFIILASFSIYNFRRTRFYREEETYQ
ncbi:sugar ABC transporter permease [Paenibacillus sediminis]|uniref:Maltose/maltodextrin transport system permease protein n=1 Tax=Paenibacillus sediminis TaxID=664909 RepID=A0ABS4H343_9BACL|nr:sugar ABC transporter permease [Paenibacillus sediminis]MBP1936958.1 arabinogalactan oligomer/maltooligosaccharide transport system permease protein [Paenibacillus sediminis]